MLSHAQANLENQSPDRRQHYNRLRRVLFVVRLMFGFASTLLFIRAGYASRIAQHNRSRFPHAFLAEATTTATYVLLSSLSSLPLRYLRGYWLEHRYDLSEQSRSSWAGDQLKALALQFVFVIPIAEGLLRVIRRRPDDWWLVGSALSIPFTVILARVAPVLILPLFNTYRPVQDDALARRLKELSRRSGIEVAEILEFDMSRQSRKANAFFTGIGKSKRIVLSDSLLEEFTPDQIETIVAHEIAHQANRDIWRLLTAGTLSTISVLYLTHMLSRLLLSSRFARRSGLYCLGDVEALPLLALCGTVAGIIVQPVQNAFSRYIERQADEYALELTRAPHCYASALAQLADTNLAEPDPPLVEYLLLHSHPTLKERIARARGYPGTQTT